jgi:hypothetical protein
MNWKELKALLKRKFWRHHWRETGDQRTCTTCDRCEVDDGDDWGSHWLILRAGDKSKHNGSKA